MKITVHTLIKNEERWIWFGLQSVLDQVDEIMVWDTGSTDKTVEVVRSIKSSKIKFRQITVKTPEEHTAARQKMLESIDSDWIMILDGDEIWWQRSLSANLQAIRENPDLSATVSRFINCVGDVFHFQHDSQSHYRIAGRVGPYNIRFVNRKISGLHVAKPHGGQEYRDKNEVPLQSYPDDRLCVVDAPYLHTTHLLRSVDRKSDVNTLKRGFKYRRELGRPLPRDFVFPEVFYLPRPEIVPDPFGHRSPGFVAASLVLDPARAVKHKLFPAHKSGY